MAQGRNEHPGCLLRGCRGWNGAWPLLSRAFLYFNPLLLLTHTCQTSLSSTNIRAVRTCSSKKESTRVAKSRARRSGDIRHYPQRKDGLRYKQESKNEKGATISKASAAERVLQFEEGESDKVCVRSAQCEVRDRMPSARTHARRVPSLAVASTASRSLSATTTSAVWPALALFRLRNAQ